MKNISYILSCSFICVCLCSALQASEAEEFKATLQKTAVTPFAGEPGEYQAFSQNLGDSLMATADKMLALPDLGPEDKRFGILMKYWGLVRKYGFDPKEFDQKLEAFAKSIEDAPEVNDLFKTIMENLYFLEQSQLWTIKNPKAKAEAFIKHRDRFLPYILKYCTKEDFRQLTNILAEIADRYDFDGTYGLVLSTVDPMLPILKELEKSNDFLTQACAKSTQGRAFRIRLTGKEMEYQGVATTEELIDIADYRGQVVLFSSETSWKSKAIDAYKKLFDTLCDQGLVMINQVDGMGSAETDRKNALDNEITWIITTRRGGYAKKLEDYDEKYGLQNTVFLIDKEGKVIHSWSNGLCPAVFEELKKLFPQQANVLSEIAVDLEQKEQEASAEIVKMFEKSTDSLSEMLTVFNFYAMSNDPAILSDVLTLQIRAQAMLELADVQLSQPEIVEKRWQSAVRAKVDALKELASQKLKDHPEMNPVEAYKELQQAVDELDQSPNADSMPNILFNAKIRPLFAMIAYLNQMTDSKVDYVGEIQKPWVEINRKEISRQKSLSADKRNFFFIRYYNNMFTDMLIDAMDEVDEDGSQGLVVSLCEELIPILDATEAYELQETAERFRGVARRSGSVGKEFEFECVLMSGGKIKVKDLRGKIVLVNFWATWCGPCIREFPNMKAQYEKYKDKGYEMIALSIDAEVDDITKFQKANDYPWLVGSQVKSRDAGLVDYHAHYGIQGVPATFLLDRDGKVLFRMVGSDDDRLNSELAKAFRE